MSTTGEQNTKADASGARVKFTVVVATYNYAQLLSDALRSLAAQTLQDFELLIVDDGSTDHTEAVVSEYSSRFGNLAYFKKAHTGLADTRNVGVQKAQGTHIAFLDADDFWSPEYLEVVRAKFESSPQAELMFSNGFRILANGLIQQPVFPSGLPPLCGTVQSVGELFSVCNHYLPSGMVFLKSLYEKVGVFDTRFSHGDDVHWVIRAAMDGAFCIRIDRKLLLYRYHGGNMTNNPIAFLQTWLTIYEERLRASRLGPECERWARSFARDYVLRLLGICSPSEGRSLLARSIEALGGDFILRCAYLSTYLGSTYALRPLKWVKRLAEKRHAATQRIDLTAPPEIIFQGL